MRKIVLALFILAINSPLYAQGVRYIKLTDERWEFMTKDESYRPKGEKSFEVAFQVYNDINEPNPESRLRFFMVLTFNTYDTDLQIPQNGKSLLRLGKMRLSLP